MDGPVGPAVAAAADRGRAGGDGGGLGRGHLHRGQCWRWRRPDRRGGRRRRGGARRADRAQQVPLVGVPGARRGPDRGARSAGPPGLRGPVRQDAVRRGHRGGGRASVQAGHGPVAHGRGGQRRPDSRAGAGRGGAAARPAGHTWRSQGRRPVTQGGCHRLHPLSPVILAGRMLAGLASLLAIAIVQGGALDTRIPDAIVVVILAVAAVVRWLVTRWRLEDGTLRIESGLLRRDSRQLPVTRIQSVDLVRPFLARALGLAELRIRLAGSSDRADGRLAYLTER